MSVINELVGGGVTCIYIYIGCPRVGATPMLPKTGGRDHRGVEKYSRLASGGIISYSFILLFVFFIFVFVGSLLFVVRVRS